MRTEALRSYFEKQPYTPQPAGAVLTEQEFLSDFAHEATKATKVSTTVMALDGGEMGSQVVDIFAHAPQEAEKVVVYDAFSELVSQGTVLEPYSYIPGKRGLVQELKQKQQATVQALEATGADITVLNPARGLKDRMFPFTGRSHQKISYVVGADGTHSAYVHSNNYQDEPTAQIAVKFTGENAQALSRIYDGMLSDPPEHDMSYHISDNLEVYLDSGIPGESIILKKAVSLVETATADIAVISQLPPSGEFAKALHDAKQNGKTVEVISTKRSKSDPLYSDSNIMALVSFVTHLQLRNNGYDIPLYLDPTRNMHAKLLLTDVTTDHPQAFFGSHNFAESGVKAGTQEVQVLSKDPDIVQALFRRFQDFKTEIKAYDGPTSRLEVIFPALRRSR